MTLSETKVASSFYLIFQSLRKERRISIYEDKLFLGSATETKFTYLRTSLVNVLILSPSFNGNELILASELRYNYCNCSEYPFTYHLVTYRLFCIFLSDSSNK